MSSSQAKQQQQPQQLGLKALLEQHCFLACNPSTLQQRLVSGGRNSEKYEAKMLRHKLVSNKEIER